MIDELIVSQLLKHQVVRFDEIHEILLLELLKQCVFSGPELILYQVWYWVLTQSPYANPPISLSGCDALFVPKFYLEGAVPC